MDIHEKNRVIFQFAKQYLEQNANPLKCQRYLAERKIHSLEDAFEVAVRSINDQTVLGGVIGYGDGEEGSNGQIIKRCLFDLDYKKVYAVYGNGKTDNRFKELYRSFRDAIKSNGEDNENNSWHKYAKNVCGIAAYISDFDSVEDMLGYFNRSQTAAERIALAEDIATKTPYWSFKMACNWLKDIGISGFAKPDSVLSFIFTELNLAENDEKSIFKAVSLMADDNNESVFFVDMVFWLIGNKTASVIKEIERKKGKNKEDFVKEAKEMLKNKETQN